jgi:monoamine oxidase
LQAAHGRILLAGSNIANGWGGFIDGAIESGMETACAAASLLGAEPSRA